MRLIGGRVQSPGERQARPCRARRPTGAAVIGNIAFDPFKGVDVLLAAMQQEVMKCRWDIYLLHVGVSGYIATAIGRGRPRNRRLRAVGRHRDSGWEVLDAPDFYVQSSRLGTTAGDHGGDGTPTPTNRNNGRWKIQRQSSTDAQVCSSHSSDPALLAGAILDLAGRGSEWRGLGEPGHRVSPNCSMAIVRSLYWWTPEAFAACGNFVSGDRARAAQRVVIWVAALEVCGVDVCRIRSCQSAGWVQGGDAINEKAAGLARAGSDRRTFVRTIPSSIWCRDRSFASVRQAHRVARIDPQLLRTDAGRTSPSPSPAAVPHHFYSHPRGYQLLVAIAVAIGVALRIREYIANRALWYDESLLALNIIDQPISGLFGRLGFNQAAPPGFLFVERVSADIFGPSEYALRLFPLICGIASIFLFLRVSRRLLEPVPQLIAITLFSVSGGLIYYSAEVKQYSTDVAASLLILAAALTLRSSRLTKWRATCWVVAGFVALAFSYAATFILVTVVIVLVLPRALRRPSHWSPLDLAAGLWLAGVAIAFLYAYPRVFHVVATSGGSSFPVGTEFVRTAGGALASAVGYPAGGATGSFKYFVALVGLAGFAALVRRNHEAAALVAVPLLLLMVAAALHAYPVLVRTVLFYVPFLAIVVGEGIAALASTRPSRRRLLVIALALAVCAVPATYAAKDSIAPKGREEIKPVLRHITENWRAGDSLFVFQHAQYPLRYYLECDCGLSLRTLEIPWGEATPDHFGSAQDAPALVSRKPTLVIEEPQTSFGGYLREFTALRGRRRVWLLITRIGPLERQILTYISCAGRRTDAFVRSVGSAPFSTAATYRYDLTRLRGAGVIRPCRIRASPFH